MNENMTLGKKTAKISVRSSVKTENSRRIDLRKNLAGKV